MISILILAINPGGDIFNVASTLRSPPNCLQVISKGESKGGTHEDREARMPVALF